MFIGIKFESWLTIVAIILGPLLALQVQRWLDERRERRRKKLEIFRKLMMTIGVPLNPNHVDAINSIQVEFYAKNGQDKKVLDAWRLYSSHLNQPHATGDELARWVQKKFDLLVELIYLMGQSLGYEDIDRSTIRDDNYVPQGYVHVEDQWTRIREAWLEVLDGKRPLSMTMIGPVEVQEPLKLADEITATRVTPHVLGAGKGGPDRNA